MRKKIVAGNWKMNMTTAEATALVNALKEDLANFRDVEVVLCPPLPLWPRLASWFMTPIWIRRAKHALGKERAYTGEISAGMLRELYCHYVILGHSERRQYFGETMPS